MGDKKPDDLRRAFTNSRYKCFVLEDGVLVGAGRAVADGVDCSYICDVAIHPDFQGRGLGTAIVAKSGLSAGQRRSSLRQPRFYKARLQADAHGMAIFLDQDRAIREGLVEDT